jgi:hypothetical protein
MRTAKSREKGSQLKAVKLLVAAMMVIAMMSLGGVALAQEGSGEQPPVVEPDRINRPGPSNPDVAPSIQQRGETTLPFTGSDVTMFVVIGAGAVGLGALVLRVSKVRKIEA